jgi:cyclin B
MKNFLDSKNIIQEIEFKKVEMNNSHYIGKSNSNMEIDPNYSSNTQNESSVTSACTKHSIRSSCKTSNSSNYIKKLLIPLYTRYTNQIPHEYLKEIWENFKLDELMVNPLSIHNQIEINEKMRAILVDWIIELHYKFNLTTETLFLTVNLIDRYISVKQVLRTKLQLVGIASLFIACKYEEILCPDLKDFVYMTGKTFNKEEILSTEKEILISLNFEITLPTSFRFFEIISLNFNFNEIEFTYGKYLLEYYLIDSRLNKYSPSLIALAVAYIIMKINNYENYFEIYSLLNKIHFYSNTNTLKECAKEIFYLIKNCEFLSFKAAFKKYSTIDNHKVATQGLSSLINCTCIDLNNVCSNSDTNSTVSRVDF